MIPREVLPEDPADWNNVEVSFPRLSADTPDSCPKQVADIMEYVRSESADTDKATEESLLFVRTAQVADDKYWLWSYTESDGQVCYVVFRESPDGATSLGISEPNGLSPEQYLLADYYDEVYWS